MHDAFVSLIRSMILNLNMISKTFVKYLSREKLRLKQLLGTSGSVFLLGFQGSGAAIG